MSTHFFSFGRRRRRRRPSKDLEKKKGEEKKTTFEALFGILRVRPPKNDNF